MKNKYSKTCGSFIIACIYFIYFFPGYMNASNLSTMGSFDIKELNAQKITLLFPGGMALDVSGNTLMSGDLNVTGTLTAGTFDVTALDLNSLDVSGNTLISGDLNVTGTLTAGTFDVTTLQLTNGTPFSYPLDVSGNTRLYQPNSSYGYALSVTGDSYMEGNLDVSGILSADQLDVTHITYSAVPLDVSRDVIVNSDMSVTGKTIMTPQDPWSPVLDIIGQTLINQPTDAFGPALRVTGDSIFNGDMDLSGSFTGGFVEVTEFHLSPSGLTGYVMDISGSTLVSGNIDITGILSANALDVSQITLGASILDVSRNVNISGTLDIQESIRLTPLSVPPGSPVEGMMYYDVTSHKLRVYNGTDWQNCF